MARKFRIGDKVKIVKKIGYDFDKGFRKGQCVEITEYYPPIGCDNYPYEAANKKGELGQFKPQELKLVRRAKKKS